MRQEVLAADPVDTADKITLPMLLADPTFQNLVSARFVGSTLSCTIVHKDSQCGPFRLAKVFLQRIFKCYLPGRLLSQWLAMKIYCKHFSI